MAECNYVALYAQACENRLTCIDPQTAAAIRLQLLCNILNGGGGETFNRITEDGENRITELLDQRVIE